VVRFARRLEERKKGQDVSEIGQRMQDAIEALRDALAALSSLWGGQGDNNSAKLDEARQAVIRGRDATADAQAVPRDELRRTYGPSAIDSASFRQFHAEYMVAFPTEDFDRAKKILELLQQTRETIDGPLAEAACEGTLLITGVAGAGKTQAICDIAKTAP
jgi:hypothetical protein